MTNTRNSNINIVFPKLEQWQFDVYKEISGQLNSGKRFVIKSSRQKGKTFLLKILVLEYAFKYPGTVSCIIEPVSSQCRRVFTELVSSIEGSPFLRTANASDLIIRLSNGSQIVLKSGESKKAIRGLTCTGVCVIDEAAYISDDVFETALPIINVHKCPLILVSTPCFTEGFFYMQWMSTEKNTYHFDWSDTKYDFSNYITQELLDEYQREYTPNKFKTEILGEFISDSSYLFGNYKECIVDPVDKVPVYAGIDFSAGAGADSTVITYFNKYKEVVEIWATNILTPTEQIRYITDAINSRPSLIKVTVEANSIGEVYYDSILNGLNNKIVLSKFHTNNETKKEIIEDLIIAFQKKEIGIPEDKVLIKQLAYFDIQKTKTGYTYNNKNDSVHDDYVMSLAIGYHNFKESINIPSFGFMRKR